MILRAEIKGKIWRIDMQRPYDISIPVRFGGTQLSVFGTPPATKKTVKAGDFLGAVAQGGSCNCETYMITPHCNGTHTESVGHITGEIIAVTDIVKDNLTPATLITVNPGPAGSDHYDPAPEDSDLLITRAMLEAALSTADPAFLSALIIRTLPNEAGKITRDYNQIMPAYFSHDSMRFISALPVRHLLVDMPSVDRLADEGKLGNHRIFWDVAPGMREAAPSSRTITELIYVPPEVKDGKYFLNLEVASFRADAAPSRPVLYEVYDD